ncbi:hypothetical protein [Aminobacter niigataensis]|uniref:hypothetical protein n=1 Tax=Aminobacter niigataensis TaxID=83265 RepID=UPI00298F3C0C|nr:hypothetical protein [Aminobacter niigataensis]
MKVGNYASADDATLDYYKERLSNVSLAFGGAAVGLAASSTFYRATRVSNIVCSKAQVTLTNKGSSVGAAVISGLPYSSIAGYALSVDANNMTSEVGDTHLVALSTGSTIGPPAFAQH